MFTRYNVSGSDRVVEWGEGVVLHGGSVTNADESLLPSGPDWSDDPNDVRRTATAGADGLSEADLAAYDAATRAELVTRAEVLGLDTNGNKQALIDRIREHEASADPIDDTPAPETPALDTPQEP